METALLSVVTYGAIGVELWALIDCLVRPTNAFPAVGKLTKPAWTLITVLGIFVTYWFGIVGLGVAGLIAAMVYLVDVRPAVRGVSGGRR